MCKGAVAAPRPLQALVYPILQEKSLPCLLYTSVQPTDFTLRLAAAFGQTQQRGLRYQSAREGP